jgi:hypothetical protein
MKLSLFPMIFLFIACENSSTKKDDNSNTLFGTWELISAESIYGDSSHVDNLEGKKMIKIFNETHFAFLNHDINKGKDSIQTFVSGGGRYALEGDIYTEFLEYCNYREWEGNAFEFKIEIKEDTLIQSGSERIEELGIDRKIIETYVKTNKQIN